MGLTGKEVAAFQKIILCYYRQHGRHTLPWRTTHTSPYHILVSEIMLQQTQVDRVIPKFIAFCEKFPTIQDLASAPQSKILQAWVGLGYNRRGLYLYHAAQQIVTKHNGVVPSSRHELLTLPGIGPYTAASIPVFAYNLPAIVIDTNIRSIYIHHFFPHQEKVADIQLISYIQATLDSSNPREWYSALMDYGVHLKNTIGNISRKSKHFTFQSSLHGSRREIRGALIRLLSHGPANREQLTHQIKRQYPTNPHNVDKVIDDLQKEDMILQQQNTIKLR